MNDRLRHLLRNGLFAPNIRRRMEEVRQIGRSDNLRFRFSNDIMSKVLSFESEVVVRGWQCCPSSQSDRSLFERDIRDRVVDFFAGRANLLLLPRLERPRRC